MGVIFFYHIFFLLLPKMLFYGVRVIRNFNEITIFINMERYVKIYVLKNPITDDIHYVGRSINPNVRYRSHIHLAIKSKKKNKKDAWICSLISSNLKPKMEIIDSVLEKNAIENEMFWINELKKTCDLKNERDYVENGYLFSEETRKKMSEAAKRTCNRRGTITSEEGRRNIGKGKLGTKQSSKQIEKKSKIVLQYEKNGTLVKEWPSTKEVERCLGIKQSLISSTALGRDNRKTCYGYIWKYKN